MKTTTREIVAPRRATAIRGYPRRVRIGSKDLPLTPHRHAQRRPRKLTSAVGLLGRKILVVSAAALFVLSIAQKPSMVLLFVMPTAMVAMAVRLVLGLLVAVAIKTCVPNLTRRSRTLLPGGWRTLLALALTIALLALLYNVFGNATFRKLGADDVVAHKACVTQLAAFTLLWLALLK